MNSLELIRISTGFNTPVGIDHHEPTRKVTLDPIPLVVSYAGAPDELPSTVTANLDVAPAESILRYTSPSFLALGITQEVSAKLTNPRDEQPAVGRVLTFQIGSQSTQATTDAHGIATAMLTLPAAEQPTELIVSFEGDPCYRPASTRAPIAAYLPTSFVIWGDNPKGLRVGQRVNFWGAQWAHQVRGGDYDAHADFKGYATLVDGLHACQPSARKNGNPRLTPSCWTSKPGQSCPPAPPLPEHIGVIVATSIAKHNRTYAKSHSIHHSTGRYRIARGLLRPAGLARRPTIDGSRRAGMERCPWE